MSGPISQIEVNKAVRVLNGDRLKFTARILFMDGQEIECQLPEQPRLDYNEDARECYYQYDAGGANYTWLCRASLVRVFQVEKNV